MTDHNLVTTYLLILAFVWAIPWKIVALLKAIRQKQYFWVIALACIQTLGLLEIAYILLDARKKKPRATTEK